MNLIEAIKSGRPYRRKAWGDSLNWREAFRPHRGTEGYCERYDDILADDWEIQEPKVEISAKQFWEAVKASQPLRAYFEQKGGLVGREMQSFGKTDLGDYVQATELAKRLGLGLGEPGDSK